MLTANASTTGLRTHSHGTRGVIAGTDVRPPEPYWQSYCKAPYPVRGFCFFE